MNQVDPRGNRFASNGARNATFTGNQKTAGPNANIICDMDPKWRKERKYVRLFFLDEATALAAGHRPCNRCRNAELKDFKAAWTAAGLGSSSVGAMDNAIAPQRAQTHQSVASSLPTGAIVEVDGALFTIVADQMFRWSPAGYAESSPVPAGEITVITPKSIVDTLRAGYQPKLHPTTRS